jgi:putative zinc ribbon protein
MPSEMTPTCRHRGQPFAFTAREQEYYASRGKEAQVTFQRQQLGREGLDD